MTTWICKVCGYEHHGESPPETCPVCGASREEFERVAPRPPPEETAWRCETCGYQHLGSKPPESCPVCGADRSLFERVDGLADPIVRPERTKEPAAPLRCLLCGRSVPAQPTPTRCTACLARVAELSPPIRGPLPSLRESPRRRVVVVGSGIAALTAAEELRLADAQASIAMVSRESCLPYYRLNLTRLLAGEIEPSELLIHPASWYRERRIDVHLEVAALGIDRGRHELLTSRGSVFYDRLVLASGSRAFVPPLRNAGVSGVSALRSLDNARAVLQEAQPDRHVVIVGGGILGLEAAFALARRGCNVTVCEGASHLLSRQLDARAAQIVQAHLERIGLSLVFQDLPVEILGDDFVRGVKLTTGRELAADVVLISAGVRPNMLAWQKSGLVTDRGVEVDDTMRTSDPDVFAAGDVAQHRGVVYGIWPVALAMGRVAGRSAAGLQDSFAGMPLSHTVKVVDIDLFSIGRLSADGPSMRECVRESPDGTKYEKLVLDASRLVGAVLAGDTTLGNPVRKLVENRTPIAGGADPSLSADDLFARVRAA